MDEEIVTMQLGLIFTQMKMARLALSSIERNTANYRGIAFAPLLSAGPKFGEPPLLAGALKVHVVNINDLVASRTSGGFIENLLGGIGRFIGGTIGGLIGGTIGGVALPYNLAQIARITDRVDRILARLGTGTEESGGPSLSDMMDKITKTIDALTNMFKAGEAPPELTKPEMPILPMLEAATALVKGLILLVPLLVGAFLSILLNLDQIKLAIVDILQFTLRNVILLRGVVLVTIYDTVAAAARLGANIMSIMQRVVSGVLNGIFDIIETLLDTAIGVIRFVGRALKETINPIMTWLRDGLGNFLLFVGDTRVFRLLYHVVDILPFVLPSIYELIKGTPMSGKNLADLIKAQGKLVPGIAGGYGTSPPGKIEEFPDVSPQLWAVADEAKNAITQAGGQMIRKIQDILDIIQGGLKDIGGTMNEALTKGETDFNDKLQGHLATVKKVSDESAQKLAVSLTAAQKAAEVKPEAGLAAIATAYQKWLEGDGFKTLMGSLTDYFARTPTVGPDVAVTIPGQVVTGVGTMAGRARATVEIGEVTIDLVPPTPAAAASPQSSLAPFDPEAWHDYLLDLDARAGDAKALG